MPASNHGSRSACRLGLVAAPPPAAAAATAASLAPPLSIMLLVPARGGPGRCRPRGPRTARGAATAAGRPGGGAGAGGAPRGAPPPAAAGAARRQRPGQRQLAALGPGGHAAADGRVRRMRAWQQACYSSRRWAGNAWCHRQSRAICACTAAHPSIAHLLGSASACLPNPAAPCHPPPASLARRLSGLEHKLDDLDPGTKQVLQASAGGWLGALQVLQREGRAAAGLPSQGECRVARTRMWLAQRMPQSAAGPQWGVRDTQRQRMHTADCTLAG